jgi:hypothetical protein
MLIPTLSLLSVLPSVELRGATSGPPGGAEPPARAPIASPMDPGSLPRGRLAVRAGLGVGSGPLGVGAQTAIGLGGVDLLVDTSVIPFFDDRIKILGGGAQAHLLSAGGFRIGARTQVDVAVDSGPAFLMSASGIAASAGSSSARASLGLVLVGIYEGRGDSRDPEKSWGAGPEIGASLLGGEHLGLGATFGYLVPIRSDDASGPIFSLNVIVR